MSSSLTSGTTCFETEPGLSATGPGRGPLLPHRLRYSPSWGCAWQHGPVVWAALRVSDRFVPTRSDRIGAQRGGRPLLLFAQICLRSLRARFGSPERGQTLVEYGLLLTLMALIVIIALVVLGPIVSRMFQNAAENVNVATS